MRTYGATDWEDLNRLIRDVLVDLRFRGDHHPESRRRVQPPVVANDLTSFRSIMTNRPFWISVPQDRFERRAAYLG